MKLEIISPEKIHYEGEVQSVSLPGTFGAFTILKNHAPIISSLQKGIIGYLADGQQHEIAIDGGFIEAKQNLISVCIEKHTV